ncbi:uncharacterized protein F4812DRAFT_212271 [Daldinia caldariorum]|uniref:uncharacterized protein n=1 Tax=Daldinia caldariorum TaxID=326644 RepID=UPI002007FB92|nr:uncharacterized protein F4812DRAFT_212271 [Daldinia caldariorum]KAI1464450.1 hypothetical protein F4812DRAFT_212271 [Daldinia caldariorum]
MASETNSVPVVGWKKGLSPEEFDQSIKQASRCVRKGVDDALSPDETEELQRAAASYHWQSCWKFMLHIFQCSPWDLTTWGLRFDNKSMSASIRELQLILPHPIWEGNIDILRYVLQKAVIFRLRADVEPLGPLAPGIADVLIANEKEATPDLALQMWAGTNPSTNSNIAALLKLLSTRQGKFGQSTWPRSPFLITFMDVYYIRDCLDLLKGDYRAPFTVQQYYDFFVRQETRSPNLATIDNKTI